MEYVVIYIIGVVVVAVALLICARGASSG